MRIILRNLSLIFIIIKLTTCGLYDEIVPSKYCPQAKHCEQPDSHLVCKFYKPEPQIPTNPPCPSYHPLTLNSQHVEQIINNINTIRIRIAAGTETGENGVVFPRGYGIMRVMWDSELAAFAKIMVKRCAIVHDYSCCGTDRFSNPLMAYMWHFDEEDVGATIDGIFHFWESYKNITTTEMIHNSPSMKAHNTRRYIKLIMGGLTHMGCAIAGYNAKDEIYANHLICYLSIWVEQNEPLYTTTPPVPMSGYTDKCGCPPNFRETEGCLCVEVPKRPLTTSTTAYFHSRKINKLLKATSKNVYYHPTQENRLLMENKWGQGQFGVTGQPCTGPNCDTKIVLLPIFSIKDAPSKNSGRKRGNRFGKKIQSRRFDIMNLGKKTKSMEDHDSSEENYETPNMFTRQPKKKSKRSKNKYPFKPFATPEEFTEAEFYSAEKNLSTYHQRNHKASVKDKKNVMSLLDILEQKGKHVNLNSHEIEVFDAKMRKIYQTVLKKQKEKQIQQIQE